LEAPSRARKALQNSIYGNNCPSAQINLSNSNCAVWTRSLLDAVIFILLRLFDAARWLLWLLLFARRLMGATIDAVAAALFRRYLSGVLVEANCVRMVRFIQDSIFSAESPATTDQEKILRMELAQRLTLEYFQEQLPNFIIKAIGQKKFRMGIQAVFRTLQYPRLNKQLSYVLLDVITRKLFPLENFLELQQ
uniref:Nexin_C domain-containing protein n=1 Tax=Gongylonema pulchrum TaxID=637853 RepID=A0A183EBV2_9BILA